MRLGRYTIFLVLVFLVAFPRRCPAPLVYRPGEGWVYETPGEEGKWTRQRAEEQLEVAQDAFDAEQYGLAIKAAKRTVKVWPLSDHAPQAQYLLGRSYQAKGSTEKAFAAYQKLLEKYPKFPDTLDVLQRQFEIANLYLDGKWFKLWGVVPLFPSMQKTVNMYEKIVHSAPYSPVAPQAQMNIGAARENQASFFNKTDPFAEAVLAYETAADRYHDQTDVASTAIFRAGLAYYKQARKADYDQSVAQKAYSTFTDFITLYPNDERVAEAQDLMTELRQEQARGNYNIARYYEKKRRLPAAMIYYNEAFLSDPSGPLAEQSRKKLDTLRAKVGSSNTSTNAFQESKP